MGLSQNQFCLEVCLELPPKRKEIREQSFCKTSFQVGMDLKTVQKQGRDERTQEDYPVFAVYLLQM